MIPVCRCRCHCRCTSRTDLQGATVESGSWLAVLNPFGWWGLRRWERGFQAYLDSLATGPSTAEMVRQARPVLPVTVTCRVVPEITATRVEDYLPTPAPALEGLSS